MRKPKSSHAISCDGLRFKGPHFLISGATGRGTKELTER